MKIAIQGEFGSFSHEAALKLIPEGVVVPCALSADVFAALDSGAVEAAVIPIENSLAGSVLEHFDLLLTHDVRVVRETLLRIRHNLIALPGVAVDEIERVYSHPVALAQCRRFLAAHPAMKALAAYDTAGSVKQLMEEQERHAAAIASEAAARHYGAQILASGIEDNPANFTRFFLVRRAAEAVNDPEPNKMSLAFSVKNRPGSLVVALVDGVSGYQPDQDRVAAGAGKAVGVRLLCGLPDSLGRGGRERHRNAPASLRHGEGAGPLSGSGSLKSAAAACDFRCAS